MTWTLLQQSGRLTGAAGTLNLQLPSTGSTVGSMLLAVVANTSNNPFTGPAAPQGGEGWEFARAEVVQGYRVEIWHFRNNSGGLYFGSNATWTSSGGSTSGYLYEFASPPSTQQIFDCAAFNGGAGSGASMPVSMGVGSFNGSLGIVLPLQVFSTPITSSPAWVTPAGYTRAGQISNGVTQIFALMYNLGTTSPGSAVASAQSVTTGFTYSGTATLLGFNAMFLMYRAASVNTIKIDGAEPTNCLDISPDGQTLFVGGDVEGAWRSADYGNTWGRACYGFDDSNQVSFADVKYSLFGPATGQQGYLYACTGKDARAGGFCASADGGCTWQILNTKVSFYGNATPSPPRPSGDNQDTNRGTGQSIAQDTTNGIMYCVTGNLGVCRSLDFGNTWTPIGPAGFWNTQTMFPRCIIINPANPAQLWVGMWCWNNNGNGGIFTTTNANATSATGVQWTQVGDAGATIGQLKLLGSFVYAACYTKGLFRLNTTDGSWNNLNAGQIDVTGSSYWLTVDGYIDGGGNHWVYVGCSNGLPKAGASKPNFTNVISMMFSGGATPGTYTDLTGPATITLATIPPYGNAWWHNGSNWQFWLGGNNSVNPHILVDPNTTGNANGPNLYLSNSGGWFICQNPNVTPNSSVAWQLAVTGMGVVGTHGFAIDPNQGSHFVARGSDFAQIDVGYTTNQQTNPGDPSGQTASQVVPQSPDSLFTQFSTHHRESHAVCFDPADSRVYVGLNTAYSKTNGGAVAYRNANPGTQGNPATWHDTGFTTQVSPSGANAPAVMGLCAGTTNGNRWAVASVAGQGPWYWDGSTWRKSTMVAGDNNPLPASNGNVDMHVEMLQGTGAGVVYCYDRQNGLYRSADQGASWQMIWKQATSDNRTGWMVINPAPPTGTTELWFGLDTGLYQMTHAGSGVVGQSGGGGPTVTQYGTGTVFQAGAAGVAITQSGVIIAYALEGSAGIEPSVPTLYVSYNNGATWADWTNGDSSVASYVPPAGQLGISISGFMWGAGGENIGVWDQVPIQVGQAALSGQGTLTANPQFSGKGTAALSGVGNMTANGLVAQSAHLSGTGTLTAAATKTGPFAGVAALNGVGTMTALPALITSVTLIPPYLVNQPLLISDMNDWFTWNIAYKTQPTDRPNTITQAPDPDLVLPILAGASYEIRAVIFYDGPKGANLEFSWLYPADSVMYASNVYVNGSNVNQTYGGGGNSNQYCYTDNSTAFTQSQEVLFINANLQAGLTAGTLAFQWAQHALNGNPVIVNPNSLMMMRRIA